MSHAKILIIGVGNLWRCDDGIGLELIKLLKQQEKTNFSHDYLDGGTDALALLDHILQYQKVLIIDAVNMHSSPGAFKLFNSYEAKVVVKKDVLSTHGFGLAELILLLEKLECRTELTILGIQPQTVGFGNELSANIKLLIPQLIDVINKFH